VQPRQLGDAAIDVTRRETAIFAGEQRVRELVDIGL
jgi:hypothetical protein